MILEKPPKNTAFDVNNTPNQVQQRWQNSIWQAVNWDQTTVPASSSSSGNAGQFATDGTYLYVCVATGSWKRVALSTF